MAGAQNSMIYGALQQKSEVRAQRTTFEWQSKTLRRQLQLRRVTVYTVWNKDPGNSAQDRGQVEEGSCASDIKVPFLEIQYPLAHSDWAAVHATLEPVWLTRLTDTLTCSGSRQSSDVIERVNPSLRGRGLKRDQKKDNFISALIRGSPLINISCYYRFTSCKSQTNFEFMHLGF